MDEVKIIYISMQTCGVCHAVKPRVKELAKEYKIPVEEIITHPDGLMTNKFKISLLFCNRSKNESHVGRTRHFCSAARYKNRCCRDAGTHRDGLPILGRIQSNHQCIRLLAERTKSDNLSTFCFVADRIIQYWLVNRELGKVVL